MNLYQPFKMYRNIQQAYASILRDLVDEGREVDPRGSKTVELSPYAFSVQYPTANIIRAPRRKLNPYFMAAEALWILGGMADTAPLAHFMPVITKFYDSGETFGAYGPRFRAQLPYVLDTLAKDRTSRQAVMSFWRPEIWVTDQKTATESGRFQTPRRHATRDVPCTLSHQYLIRRGQLDLIVTMRSNDVWRGLTYDFFNFTTMQRFVAARLGVPIGHYHHVVGSMHLYTEDWYAALKCLEDLEGWVKTGEKQPSFEYANPMEGGPHFIPGEEYHEPNIANALRLLADQTQSSDPALTDRGMYPAVFGDLYKTLIHKDHPQFPVPKPWSMLIAWHKGEDQ